MDVLFLRGNLLALTVSFHRAATRVREDLPVSRVHAIIITLIWIRMLVLKFGLPILAYLGHHSLKIALLLVRLAVYDIVIQRGSFFGRKRWLS